MKKTFQDIIPPEKRSIRNIPIPAERKREEKREEKKEEKTREEVSNVIYYPEYPKVSGGSKIFLWLGAIMSAAVLAFLVLYFVTEARITIAPKQMTFGTGGTIEGRKTGDGLLYSTIEISDEKEIEVPATAEKEVSEKATGKIIIYNNSGTTAQKLIAGTRFQTPGGLIYKLSKEVTVPGKKGTAAGTVEADVTAEKPGKAYNIGLNDFTIPGFKGTAKFDTIYARSKTPMTGGEEGKVKVPAKEDLDKANTTLEEQIKAEAEMKLGAQIPEGFVFPKGALSISFEGSTADAGEGKVTVKRVGKIKGTALETKSLGVALGKLDGQTVDTSEVFTLDLEKATVKINETTNGIAATVDGTTVLEYKVDIPKLLQKLAGKTKTEAFAIMGAEKSIGKGQIILRPFWRTKLPKDPEDINVEI